MIKEGNRVGQLLIEPLGTNFSDKGNTYPYI